MAKTRLLLDFETRSEADLKKVGGFNYAAHPSTEIICVGFKVDEGATELIGLVKPENTDALEYLKRLLSDEKCMVEAHNAIFEWAIIHHVLKITVPLKRMSCTAARAAACGLPRDLDGVSQALGLSHQKDMKGHRLMLKVSKPRPKWKKWHLEGRQGEEPAKWYEDADELSAVYEYCRKDIDAEAELSRLIPDLIGPEKSSWRLTQKVNIKGVRVDVPTARLVVKMAKKKANQLTEEIQRLTNGAVASANQRDKMLGFLKSEGLSLPTLTAGQVDAALSLTDLNPKARRALEIRQALSKSSVKKYEAIIARASKVDHRVRDFVLWHGAHTGREAGRGLQLQNMPRGKVKNTAFAIEEVVKSGDVDLIEMVYGDLFSTLSSVMRGMIMASEQNTLFVADFNAIEARVLSWVAGDEAGLKDFREGKDPYRVMAARIFSKPEDEITDEERFVGKGAILGLGFGMGFEKFLATCHKQGATYVTEGLARKAVEVYRRTKPSIPALWKLAEAQAIRAVNHPGTEFKALRVAYVKRGDFLECRLPSGRSIRYYRPKVSLKLTPWGHETPELSFWRVDGFTKKWCHAATYGGHLVENFVQGIARDLMVEASKRVERAGYEYLFSVHDEIVSEHQDGDLMEYERLIATTPEWAEGLPVVAKGFSDFRYKK